MRRAGHFLTLLPVIFGPAAQGAHAQQAAVPIATMPVTDAKLTGAVEVKAKLVELSSGAAIEAGDAPVPITLARGGSVMLCQNSALHLSKGANAGEIQLALDRGAVELRSDIGQFSDVLLTPDLRMLLSGPATADFKVRINPLGDTCVENSGANAPYVTVTEQLSSAVYRVAAGQHVEFEHGSVGSVVDNEKEPCGCPAPAPAVDVATGKPPFPLAESEGLAKPAPQTTPVVPAGETHEVVAIPFTYNGANPAPPQEPPATPAPQPASAGTPAAVPAAKPPQSSGGTWISVKHFFRKLFGKS